MTYEEANKELLKVKWKTKACHEGEGCWCRMIIPEEPIVYTPNDGRDESEIYIAGPASLDKEHAEYFVDLHNRYLNENN